MKNKEKQREVNSKAPETRTKDLRTEPPISEKDEVKKAEGRTNKSIRHHL